MPKATNVTAKPSKSLASTKTKPEPEKTTKREPSAYNLFCKKHMKDWIAAHPGRSKEAMAHMALLWKDAPENPNRGKPSKSKSKRPKASSASTLSDPPTSDD